MKLAILERQLEDVGKPNGSALPGHLLWSTFDYHRRVAVYLIQHDDGVEIPTFIESRENGKLHYNFVCDS